MEVKSLADGKIVKIVGWKDAMEITIEINNSKQPFHLGNCTVTQR